MIYGLVGTTAGEGPGLVEEKELQEGPGLVER